MFCFVELYSLNLTMCLFYDRREFCALRCHGRCDNHRGHLHSVLPVDGLPIQGQMLWYVDTRGHWCTLIGSFLNYLKICLHSIKVSRHIFSQLHFHFKSTSWWRRSPITVSWLWCMVLFCRTFVPGLRPFLHCKRFFITVPYFIDTLV